MIPAGAPPFDKRLPARQNHESWQRIARSPSYLAPRAIDIQSERPFTPPQLQNLLLEDYLVAANPESEEARLQLADACDRHGDSRGQFIRAQVEIARCFKAGRLPSAVLVEEEQQFLPGLLQLWSERLSPWAARDLVFRRGCIERMSLAGRSLLSLGHELLRGLPLRGIRLVGIKWLWTELLEKGSLKPFRRVDLSRNRIGVEGVNQLAKTDLPRLVKLNLSRNNLGQDGFMALLQADWRWQIRELDLSDNDIHSLEPLLNDPAFVELESLNIANNPIRKSHLEKLSQWPCLRMLQAA